MLVTAAFVGPGTVTTCSLAGARFGTSLLWALGVSILAGMILQEMSARLGVLGDLDLASALHRITSRGGVRLLLVPLVLLAVVFGCASFEVGNLIGGGLGLATAVGGDHRWWAVLCGIGAGILLAIGGYRLAGRILTVLVGLMGACFLATAVAVAPAWKQILKGAVVPSMEPGSVSLVLALVGTTVVPYNLFLHSAAARNRWRGTGAMGEARYDMVVSMAVGGCISAAILITASGVLHGASGGDHPGAAELARQLEPVLGSWARALFGLGLFAAGLTSAMTAPLAAAAALTGILGCRGDPDSKLFRAGWVTVLGIGMTMALIDWKPLTAILVAQAANGLLLPFAAGFLLLAMNDRATLGENRNRWFSNLLGIGVVILVLLLGWTAVAGVIRSG
jgi:Mn2+/Fe2+ NRAMP family transporter